MRMVVALLGLASGAGDRLTGLRDGRQWRRKRFSPASAVAARPEPSRAALSRLPRHISRLRRSGGQSWRNAVAARPLCGGGWNPETGGGTAATLGRAVGEFGDDPTATSGDRHAWLNHQYVIYIFLIELQLFMAGCDFGRL